LSPAGKRARLTFVLFKKVASLTQKVGTVNIRALNRKELRRRRTVGFNKDAIDEIANCCHWVVGLFGLGWRRCFTEPSAVAPDAISTLTLSESFKFYYPRLS
jgi:hypothetical protein